jgi:epoxyqueuosine reductase
VCPWNSPGRTPIAVDPELASREELVNPLLEWLASMDETAFERSFNGSPVRRAQFHGMQRNVAIAMGNAVAKGGGDAQYIGRLREWAESTDEGVRAAAEWALEQCEDRGGNTAEDR